MNKVININLGGYALVMDEDAFEHLENYLDTLRHHFRKSDGCDEILEDIEIRMAELFQEQIKGKSIVGVKDVQTAIGIMGTPKEFGVGDDGYHAGSQYSSSEYKTGKRLFRESIDQQVGGVCAGLAAYFGIEDPLWVRLAFVIFTISGGFGVMIYAILWIMVPEAKTANDQLLMRGEPINVSNIARIVEDEVEQFTEKISEWGEGFKSKKK